MNIIKVIIRSEVFKVFWHRVALWLCTLTVHFAGVKLVSTQWTKGWNDPSWNKQSSIMHPREDRALKEAQARRQLGWENICMSVCAVPWCQDAATGYKTIIIIYILYTTQIFCSHFECILVFCFCTLEKPSISLLKTPSALNSILVLGDKW